MVAAAEEAVERMFVGVQSKLSAIDEPIQALRHYPDALWEVQNQPPARAYAELQLASRWELGLQAQLRRSVKAVNERMGRELREVAELIGLGDTGKLMEDENRVADVLSALTRHYNDCLDELIG